MRYMGGKGRIAKEITATMLNLSDKRETYIEPFMGGGSVSERMVPHFRKSYLSDVHTDLALMWDAAANLGWEPPLKVSEEMFESLRHAEPSPERGFVGVGAAFAGRWFRGYARPGKRSDGQPRDYIGESHRAVKRIATKISGANVSATSFFDLDTPPSGAVVYCDPPYAGTEDYRKTSFNSDAFWTKAGDWAEAGASVFVSEYHAPEDWESVWQKPVVVQVGGGRARRGESVEKLFRWKGVK